ncbi:MAG: DUF2948 family protein [Pseudomonadota bacterium]
MDARFEDAPFSDQPLRLKAEGAEDLQVIATLCQDAVYKTKDIHWMPRARRLALILHRFRWEDAEAAAKQRRPFERVQSALTLYDVTRLQARGLDQSTREAVTSILTLAFEAGEDGAGRLQITGAGGAEIMAEVECINVALSDLTQPWRAVAPKAPDHTD